MNPSDGAREWEGRGPAGRLPDETAFASAAAPGLDEDDIFIAMLCGDTGTALWGAGRPWPERFGPDLPWSEERERRRRHEQLLRRWETIDRGDSPA